VGIAGEQTGIYPIESPGGWRIIGRTYTVLFDPRRDPPCLLSPGDLVRFVPVERLNGEGFAHSHKDARDPFSGVGLEVLSPGVMTTVQDQGRYGYERFGVPPAGAMDWLALYTANRLVGNAATAAGLEFALDPPVLRAAGDCLIALTGCGWRLAVDGRAVGAWRAAVVRNGEEISIEPEERSGWGYLAVSGGIGVPPLMGSRATYLRSGFGGLDGRALREGDVLLVSAFPTRRLRRAGSWLSDDYRPQYASDEVIPVVPGPQEADFGPDGLQKLFAGEYAITAMSDRMGYRLSGPPLVRVGQGELLSQGIAPGSIQIPPDGQPIVLMADRPTAGGYPKIATVTRIGLPLLAQAMPGVGRVRFAPVSVEEAQARLRQMMQRIEVGMEEENED
jgi:antagonist of KipI